jgi:hypothetical protein
VLRGLGVLRGRWPFKVTVRRARFLQRLANLLLPFGTDRGGMRVAVVGRRGGTVNRREWRLIAEAGDGPYVPAVAARALIRCMEAVPPGARACLAEATLAEIEAAMSDLSVSTARRDTPYPTLFQSALADRWAALPPEVQTCTAFRTWKASQARPGSLVAPRLSRASRHGSSDSRQLPRTCLLG